MWGCRMNGRMVGTRAGQRVAFRASRVLAVMAMAAALEPACQAEDAGPLRINEQQLLGTHNSYHIAPDAFTMAAIESGMSPESAR